MTRQHYSWTIDAIADDVARVELDGDRMVTVPSWILPSAAVEGDVLRVSHQREDGRSVIVIDHDPDATRAALQRSARQLADMPLDHGPTGDIVL